jgi:N-acetylglucosamine kinase-like BadF-type ATPase
MERFLGIDAGGTTTRAALLDSTGRVLGLGSAGSGNYHDAGISTAVGNMRFAAEEAFRASGERLSPVRALFAGCAGVKSRTDIDRITAALGDSGLATGGAIRVCNDLHNALAGGLSGRPGIALIAGTGSNCLGCDASGAFWMCGGWGWLLDAPGSAFGLTLAAMRTATREADGRDAQGPLLPALLDFLGISEPDDLLARLYCEKWTTEDLAAFAPVIVETAKQGDAAALRILREGARALAELVATTASRLDFPDGPEVVVLGGCARSGAPYQPLVEEAIREACLNAHIIEPAGPPLRGAALNALRLGGVDLPADFQLP